MEEGFIIPSLAFISQKKKSICSKGRGKCKAVFFPPLSFPFLHLNKMHSFSAIWTPSKELKLPSYNLMLQYTSIGVFLAICDKQNQTFHHAVNTVTLIYNTVYGYNVYCSIAKIKIDKLDFTTYQALKSPPPPKMHFWYLRSERRLVYLQRDFFSFLFPIPTL